MAETSPAAPTSAPAKAPKKKKTSLKPKKTSPSVSDLIVKAVLASNECHGLSLARLKKAFAAGGYDVEKNNIRVKLAIKSMVSKGALVQTKGASGSFKINKKQAEAKEKAGKENEAPKKKPVAKLNPIGARGHRHGEPKCLRYPGPQHFRHTQECWGKEDQGYPE
ncbi:histone H1-like [Polypterus senegalus]|uniref:histone H1-like n=1 Tax=Polypterus senegalus TaxID=55291 RepID=UPI001965FF12|nr:histone H1-like [Polypterus senegalus]